MDRIVVKGVIESLLFVSDSPLPIEQICAVLEGLERNEILQCVDELRQEYESSGRGLRIVEVAGGYQFVTAPQYLQFLKQFYKQKHKERLRPAALETLAIIAYKQPLTRIDVEAIRGVNVDGVIKSLTDKGLIRTLGRKKGSPGRPFVYGTTKVFLERFGLNSLDDLPDIEDFKEEAASLYNQEEDDAVKDTAQTDKQA